MSKLDADGNFVWARAMGGSGADIATAVGLAADGSVCTTGSFSSTAADFDPSPSAVSLLGTNGNSDIFISKLDAAGNFVWAAGLGGTQSDYGYAVTAAPNGDIYTAGSFQGPTDFAPGSDVYSLTSAGSSDAFLWQVRGNRGPTAVGLSATSVPENAPAGTTVGVLSTTDPDLPLEKHTYSLVAGAGDADNASFQIVGNQLQTAAAFDYENRTAFSIRVRTADQGGLSRDEVFVIAVSDQPEVSAGDWTDAGLTLTLADDGMLHIFRTGTTTDAVPPCDPATVVGISIVGRGASDVLIDGYAGQYATLYVKEATLRINQDNTISASTAVTIDGGCLDLGGKSDSIGSLTLVSGSVVSGTLNAASYTIRGGTVSATLGPGPMIKQTTGAATVTTPINATTIDVQAGQLTATSIVADTLVIGAGSSVVIAEVVPPGSAASLATAAATPSSPPVDPTTVLTQASPVAVVAVPVTAVSTATVSVGPLPTTTPKPAATDAELALASSSLPVATTAPTVAPQAAALEPTATCVADAPTFDHLTLLLAIERSATELSAQRHLRAIDTILAEASSFIADLPDAFAPATSTRRKMANRSVAQV